GYLGDDYKIDTHDRRFEDVADDIIADIRSRQPRAGRAIFLLDQCGFSRVSLDLVARILSMLPGAEVILTFAADVLINFLNERPQFIQAVARLDLTESQIHEMIQLRNGDGGKALVQRVLRNHIRNITGATYDTPFYLEPQKSRRELWFLHLSRHPTARDVMIQCHWDNSNTFKHYGPGGLDMLGWDALKTGNIPLFNFKRLDEEQMVEQLLDSMPLELDALAGDNPITVNAVRHILANRSAARFSDLDRVILRLAQEREFDILTPELKERSRNLQRLNPTDLIAVPTTRQFSILSRRRQETES
ncbi:MAG: three-Cys-motif partner protein TcmP, partial [Chloroflexota bacterium]|nr:three-Cys-motif partner protein TcmP [Chloroflexota bacterium]